jgi:hypothetical protein
MNNCSMQVYMANGNSGITQTFTLFKSKKEIKVRNPNQIWAETAFYPRKRPVSPSAS